MIIRAKTAEQIEEIRNLFREYEKWLGLDLCFQNFEEELAILPGRYAKPDGILLIIYRDKKAAGCVALRRIEKGICEMKRLFVREDFRGLGLGNLLIKKLIHEAREIGYEKMRLDTLPGIMNQAAKLYELYGFCEIPPYYENPHKETLFLELNLATKNSS